IGRQELERARPVLARRLEVAGATRGFGAGREALERIAVAKGRARGTRERVGRQLRAATDAGRRGHTGTAGGVPTRYGPVITRAGVPVIFHAGRIPKKMIAALMMLDGRPPTTTTTGSAAMSPRSVAIASAGDGRVRASDSGACASAAAAGDCAVFLLASI